MVQVWAMVIDSALLSHLDVMEKRINKRGKE